MYTNSILVYQLKFNDHAAERDGFTIAATASQARNYFPHVLAVQNQTSVYWYQYDCSSR